MIRPYRPGDLAALRRICVLTADAGADATGQYSSDDLMPDVFLEPYVTLVPETAWVVEEDGRPVGYLVAALDTRDFVRRWRTEWSPIFAFRHPRALTEPRDLWLHEYASAANWRFGDGDGNGEYPAHLHIDLLPEAQGRGNGRALMRELGLAAVVAGVPGVHLTMSPDNPLARAFYERLGFRALGADDDVLTLGIASEALTAGDRRHPTR